MPSSSATDSRNKAAGAKPRLPVALEQAGEIIPGQFMGVNAPLAKARFLVLPLPFERTTSYKKGTGKGPLAFIEGSLGVELWDDEVRLQTYLAGINTLPAVECGEDEPTPAYFKRIEAVVEKYARMKDKVLFSVGGEHSVAQPVFEAFSRVHPGLSFFHIDAHADLRPEYEGSPHNHACALYPISRKCRVVQTGIRSIAEEEAHLVDAGNVTTFTAAENRDVKKLIPKVLKALGDTVYITIDLDGFDPSVVPGVGTPQPGGFSWYEGLDLIRAVISSKKIVGCDIMELCPLEDTVESEIAAAKLAYRMMGYIEAKTAKKPAR